MPADSGFARQSRERLRRGGSSWIRRGQRRYLRRSEGRSRVHRRLRRMPRPLRSGRKPTLRATNHTQLQAATRNLNDYNCLCEIQLIAAVPPSSNSTRPKEPMPPFERRSSSSNAAPTPRAGGAGTATTAITSPLKPKPNALCMTNSATKPILPRTSSRKGFGGRSKPSKVASNASNVVRTRHNHTSRLIAQCTTSGAQRSTATTYRFQPWMGAISVATSFPMIRRLRRRSTSPTRISSFGWRTCSTATVTGTSTPRCGKSKPRRNRLNPSPSTEQSLVWIWA